MQVVKSASGCRSQINLFVSPISLSLPLSQTNASPREFVIKPIGLSSELNRKINRLSERLLYVVCFAIAVHPSSRRRGAYISDRLMDTKRHGSRLVCEVLLAHSRRRGQIGAKTLYRSRSLLFPSTRRFDHTSRDSCVRKVNERCLI